MNRPASEFYIMSSRINHAPFFTMIFQGAGHMMKLASRKMVICSGELSKLKP